MSWITNEIYERTSYDDVYDTLTDCPICGCPVTDGFELPDETRICKNCLEEQSEGYVNEHSQFGGDITCPCCGEKCDDIKEMVLGEIAFKFDKYRRSNKKLFVAHRNCLYNEYCDNFIEKDLDAY